MTRTRREHDALNDTKDSYGGGIVDSGDGNDERWDSFGNAIALGTQTEETGHHHCWGHCCNYGSGTNQQFKLTEQIYDIFKFKFHVFNYYTMLLAAVWLNCNHDIDTVIEEKS